MSLAEAVGFRQIKNPCPIHQKGKTWSAGDSRRLRVEGGNNSLLQKSHYFCPEISVTAQNIIGKGWCFHLDACAAPGLWGQQTLQFSLSCWALVLDYIRKEAQLCLSSACDGKIQLLEAVCSIVTARLNSADIPQKNLRKILAA